jgi:hypothetical protein
MNTAIGRITQRLIQFANLAYNRQQLTQLNISNAASRITGDTNVLTNGPNYATAPSSGDKLYVKAATSQQGSIVPSPLLDDMRRLSLYADFVERQPLYQEMDKILYNLGFAEIPLSAFVSCALGQGATHSIEPVAEKIGNAAFVDQASQLTQCWNEIIESVFPVEKQQQILRGKWHYGFAAMEIAVNQSGEIVAIQPLPPQGFKINHEYGRLNPYETNTYEQRDAANLSKLIAQWPEANIITYINKHFDWQIYGMPALLPVLTQANSLLSTMAIMGEMRQAAQSQTFVLMNDGTGQSVDPYTYASVLEGTRMAKIARGGKVSPYDVQVLNGASQVVVDHYAGKYFEGLADIDLQAAMIAAIFGDSYARLFKGDIVNRATLELIEEARYARAYEEALDFQRQVMVPLFRRMVAFLNQAWQARTGQTSPLFDPRDFLLKTEFRARRTPTRLKEEAEAALAAHAAGLLDKESAVQVYARYLEVDPETVLNKLSQEGNTNLAPDLIKQQIVSSAVQKVQSSGDLNKLANAIGGNGGVIGK